MASKQTLREKVFGIPILYKGFQKVVGAQEEKEALFKRLFNLESKHRILDIGCGEGASSSAIASQVESYVGIDHSEAYISSAKKTNAKHSNARFLVADASDPAVLEMGPFDLVMVSGVLHHLDSPTISEMLNNATRVLNPGGRFVALEPVFTETQGLVARLTIAADRGRFARDREGYERLLEPHFRHVSCEIHDDLVRIPYTHICISAQN